MSFKIRGPSLKIGGVRFRKNQKRLDNVKISKRYNPSFSIFGVRLKKTKNGVSVSSKNVFGGANTYNTGTGVQTKSYSTIIPGVKYQKRKQIGGNKSKTNTLG